ncbi:MULTISPECIES: proteasome-activating nucleotidase [Acidilobus]|uniref:Proteasome-activating nucleotidase n=1 Tax=Acidilobus saccharovorans (strain DSM 16705 / JCM 18335 / VKM B-2471 / 345-15) TaxID=666510 RepID=D9Q064_ACIS3|nr:proteasome-activating nucleotidase [Acidilobus saccharovorans]ADL18702.1 Proteasome-activating nucleotidase [Acidilobus saccharovorans 345-15]
MSLSESGKNTREKPDDDELSLLREKVRYLTQLNMNLEKDLEFYKQELNKLLEPPYIEAMVLEVLSDGRAVVKSSTGPNLVVRIASNVDIDKLRPGASVALNNKGSTIVEVLPSIHDPLVEAMEIEERPSITFKDVGGLEEQIREIYEVVGLPLIKPQLFDEIGVEPPKGVLLYGPPGTGKTLVARALAGEVKATFIRVVASQFVNKFIGEGARIVREVFRLAKEKKPSIIFIDEIDAIGSRRVDMGTSGDREVQRTMLQLLAEMDGFDPLEGVKVVAATNRIDLLDPALLRPGRFDRIIEIPLPDKKGRLEILKIHTRNMKLKDVDLEEIASMTEGFSGAELKAVATEAGFFAIRDGKNYVSQEHFIKAVDKVRNRMEKRKQIFGTHI